MRRLLVLIALLFALAGTTLAQEDDHPTFTIQFAASVGEETALCGETYTEIGPDEAEISFNDFRLYVSNIHLIDADGEETPLALEQDGLWQVDNVALLDFEDGTASCSEIGNAALNGEVIGTAPAGDYVGVRFDMGVPFDLNHEDVTLTPAPLNIAALWWSWQGGYKFIRLDLMTDGPEAPYNVHIGSTGCESPAAVISPEEPCSRPNVTTITFETFDFENNVIVADLAGLLGEVPVYDNTLMPPGCMAGVDDPDCPAVYASFGLSLETGTCMDDDCSTQTVFRVAERDDVELVERTMMEAMQGMDMNMDAEATEEADHSGHGG